MVRGKLILADGTVFRGESFGAEVSTSGEIVFSTGMVGYPESLTDPSFRGQILTFTYPLQGNYGIPGNNLTEGLPEHFESADVHVRGVIVADYPAHNHWQSEQSLGAWLTLHSVPALFGIDTRALTKKLRDEGVMLGRIVIEGHETDDAFYDPNTQNLVAEVSCSEKIIYKRGPKRLLLIDCGVKNNIIRCFLRRNITVVRVPWDYPFFEEQYDAIFISNGPGDPKFCSTTIGHLKQAMKGDTPIFGICLGSQLLALAAGANTYKLPYGHRGQNQPCILVGTKRCFITSQNHGYAVDEATIPAGWTSWFVNANDGTNEGIKHLNKPFFSVQFHPESTPGPDDTDYLFDAFVALFDGTGDVV